MLCWRHGTMGAHPRGQAVARVPRVPAGREHGVRRGRPATGEVRTTVADVTHHKAKRSSWVAVILMFIGATLVGLAMVLQSWVIGGAPMNMRMTATQELL